MQAFVVDAYDSFVYIICQYLAELDVTVTVRRHDVVSPEDISALEPDLVVLGPGPGRPEDVGYVEIIRALSDRIPTLGICLGHQAVGIAFGATVSAAEHLMHGKASAMVHDGKGCFAGCEPGFRGGRYHSLIVDRESVTDELEVSATAADDGYVMGLRHRVLPIESVQFHPESVLTEGGLGLIENFIGAYVGRGRGAISRG